MLIIFKSLIKALSTQKPQTIVFQMYDYFLYTNSDE